MALNINTPLYLVSVGTTLVTIQLTEADRGKFNSLVVMNMGVDPVFIVSGPTAPVAVYPTGSTTASTPGDIFVTGRSTTARINPTDGFISLIRKTAAVTADVAISLGADY